MPSSYFALNSAILTRLASFFGSGGCFLPGGFGGAPGFFNFVMPGGGGTNCLPGGPAAFGGAAAAGFGGAAAAASFGGATAFLAASYF